MHLVVGDDVTLHCLSLLATDSTALTERHTSNNRDDQGGNRKLRLSNIFSQCSCRMQGRTAICICSLAGQICSTTGVE